MLSGDCDKTEVKITSFMKSLSFPGLFCLRSVALLCSYPFTLNNFHIFHISPSSYMSWCLAFAIVRSDS